MLHQKLKDLLETMSGKFDSSTPVVKETESWKAYRIAEQLNDPKLFPDLLDCVRTNNPAHLRKFAAVVLGYLLQNTRDTLLAEQMVALTAILDKDEAVLYETLTPLSESGVSIACDPAPLIGYTTDDRELIRNSAIRALGNCQPYTRSVVEALQNVVKYFYDEYDLKYAVHVLVKLEAMETIPDLEKLIADTDNSAIREIAVNGVKKLIR